MIVARQRCNDQISLLVPANLGLASALDAVANKANHGFTPVSKPGCRQTSTLFHAFSRAEVRKSRRGCSTACAAIINTVPANPAAASLEGQVGVYAEPGLTSHRECGALVVSALARRRRPFAFSLALRRLERTRERRFSGFGICASLRS